MDGILGQAHGGDCDACDGMVGLGINGDGDGDGDGDGSTVDSVHAVVYNTALYCTAPQGTRHKAHSQLAESQPVPAVPLLCDYATRLTSTMEREDWKLAGSWVGSGTVRVLWDWEYSAVPPGLVGWGAVCLVRTRTQGRTERQPQPAVMVCAAAVLYRFVVFVACRLSFSFSFVLHTSNVSLFHNVRYKYPTEMAFLSSIDPLILSSFHPVFPSSSSLTISRT